MVNIDWTGFEYIKPRKNKLRKIAEQTKKPVGEQLKELQDQAFLSNPNGKSGVYVFHSNADDFLYIGSAHNLEGRRQSHIDDLVLNRHINWMFQITHHRHGLDNLSFYIIEFCSPNELISHEAEYIYEFDPEINIKGVKWSTLGLDLPSMQEQQRVRNDWYKTEKGKEYKRNTIDVKRAEWVMTQVGRDCVREDIKNLREQLNNSNKSIDEKVFEIMDYFNEYFPDFNIEPAAVVKFINDGTTFKPLWRRSITPKT
jgi:group I intron endonuclease